MSSGWSDRLRHTLGFRLALWYAVLFVAGSVLLTGLTYLLLSSSLQQRDHDLVRSALDRYVRAYVRTGLPGLEAAVAGDSIAGRHESLFVRVLGPGADAVFVRAPADWIDADLSGLDGPARGGGGWIRIPGRRPAATLEIATSRLPDGTLIQVGKSTEARVEILGRFRTIVLVILASTVLVALVGGAVLTQSALRPVGHLIGAVRSILRTGKIGARVPVRDTGDALDELSGLFNGMLDRIQSLIEAMKGSLDNVAHDLRTPMTRWRGIADAALRQPPDTARDREALIGCVEEAEHVMRMLSTLMDISEAETGAMHLEPSSIAAQDVLDDAMSLYADLAEQKGVRLHAEPADGVLLHADRTRLRQVMANLLDNAVKYTPAGGTVRLSAARDDHGVTLTVSDTGPGIPRDELPRVWERLYRGDRSRSGERGLGLGLSLVRAVVEAHGGRVGVTSDPGRGATFTVTLPDRSGDVAAPA